MTVAPTSFQLLIDLEERFRSHSRGHEFVRLQAQLDSTKSEAIDNEPSALSLQQILLQPGMDADPSTSLVHELSDCIVQARALLEAPICPIMAVVGMLNAGKSSLVASFLSKPPSDSGNCRILIGSGSSQGTHRFVLWIPESWKSQANVWNFIHDRLLSVFGRSPESLSESPDTAAAQYNDTLPRSWVDANGVTQSFSPIEVPLLATDPQLDRFGIALMDCPDVQTGLMSSQFPESSSDPNREYSELSAAAAESRLEVLSKAATICSAFVLVLPANAMHDQTVRKLLEVLQTRMQQVQRILAVNRVPRRYSVAAIANEVEQLYRSEGLRSVYMAYNFDGPHDRDKIPAPPAGSNLSIDVKLPLFFQIDGVSPPQPPQAIAVENWLVNIGRRLEKKNLLADSLRSIGLRLRDAGTKAVERARNRIVDNRRIAGQLRQSIANACVGFSIDPKSSVSNPQIRLQVSRQIIQQISQSLERTAPWWARPGRWANRLGDLGKSTVASATSWIHMPRWMTQNASSIGGWIRSRFKQDPSGRIVTATMLADFIASHDRAGHFKLDLDEGARESLRQQCQQAIDRFHSESQTQLDTGQLDGLTKRMWKEMPLSKRFATGVAPAGLLFAPLIAVVMLPLDFGGTSVLFAASIKELLFAGAASVGIMLATSDSMPQIAESEAAWQQLGDLYAVLCDAVGLERSVNNQIPTVQLGSHQRALFPSRIKPSYAAIPSSSMLLQRTWEFNEDNIAQLHSLLKSIAEIRT